ncbi:UDP-N-acetylmuramoyl-tripeptide--D-alanyl-D-alanine ligase [Wenzhouxiangella marina]|uniref:UDP-N-acetylmuramoyl-tripeptide--D-alanyl-D-alanine ligase n=1 Tax=Wenzhouxiangella marina TaxID=1579979 RepID=A0A0K0XYI7_9GAMM|nr:UDP-N-acetylmuramoyl-tripeptide--D-alanyl-D-alanine ligase [Wenzhouxiangella marina]AKS42730.1 UDP-N-acetylmuramoyl-tripeptide--D-alanyl-D-alanine ligase [Wenzhouxiangella marina]MBB6088580.1 UDP-N-acetylmuramoyl-tripeptide--D-alanyl-D-alanine ligase [Wenzhouxiangella marina]
MDMLLSAATQACGGRMSGQDVAIRGLCLDSRKLQAGELFVALPGERVDGHAFVEAAARSGASAALVSRRLDVDLPQIEVADVAVALQSIAAAWRAALDVIVVGVTGSNGKTTVKEMIAAILSRVGPTLATRGNYNNELGVPVTLGRLEREHRFAVIEMGCGQAGDIRDLAALARPRVGVVTNAGPAHLERLGSLEGVARTKGELFESLPAEGVAVINADDRFFADWQARAAHCQRLSFGRSEAAQVRLLDGPAGRLNLDTPVGRIETTLAVAGEHNRMNAAAAAAVALALDVPAAEIAAGLASINSLPGRLESHRSEAGWTLIDDTYNANPASLYAGLKVLSELPGEAWLVLGDMAELGPDSDKLHAEMGQSAADLGVRRLFTLGAHAAAASRAFGPGAEHFEGHEALASALADAIHADVVCLVKGSRSSAMERIVRAMIGEKH